LPAAEARDGFATAGAGGKWPKLCYLGRPQRGGLTNDSAAAINPREAYPLGGALGREPPALGDVRGLRFGS